MQIKDNADVVDARDKHIGSVDRVVIDPETSEVSHLVTKKGILFTREKVIPLNQVERVEAQRIVLKDTADPEQLPDFEEEYHIPMRGRDDMQGYARPMLWYPRAGVMPWGVGMYPNYGTPPYYVRTRRNIPADAVALEEGAAVKCRDGKKAGKVERVFAEPDEGRVTHIMIRKGWLAKKRKLIPSVWVSRVDEDVVKLKVNCDVVEGLPVQP